MENTTQGIEHYYKVKEKFAEAVYQQMASKRYGIQFCCETELEEVSLEHEKLSLATLKQIDL